MDEDQSEHVVADVVDVDGDEVLDPGRVVLDAHVDCLVVPGDFCLKRKKLLCKRRYYKIIKIP